MVGAELQMACDLAKELLKVAQLQQDPELRGSAHMAKAIPLFWQGHLSDALEQLEKAIALFSSKKHSRSALRWQEDHCVTLCYKAEVLWHLGYPDRAVAQADQALRLARGLRHPSILPVTLIFAAWLFCLRRDLPVARKVAQEAIALASNQGLTYWLAIGQILDGWAQAQQHHQQGITQIRRGLAAYRATGAELLRPLWLGLLAETYGTMGQTQQGLDCLAEAFALAAATGERHFEADLYRIEGQLIVDAASEAREPNKAAKRAESSFLKAINVARQQAAKSLELRATVGLSRLWRSAKRQQACRMLSAIYNWFTEGFNAKDLQEARALVHDLSPRHKFHV